MSTFSELLRNFSENKCDGCFVCKIRTSVLAIHKFTFTITFYQNAFNLRMATAMERANELDAGEAFHFCSSRTMRPNPYEQNEAIALMDANAKTLLYASIFLDLNTVL